MSGDRVNCCNCRFYYDKDNMCKWVMWREVPVPEWLKNTYIEVVSYKDRECDAYEREKL